MTQDVGGNYSNQLSKHAASHAYDGFDPLTSSATSVVGDIKMAYGVLATLLGANPGWKAMDGTVVLPDGTTPPDMRDRFPIGAGTTYTLGDTGGSATLTHSTNGQHQHDTKDLSHSHVVNFTQALGGGAVPAAGSPTATTTLTHPLHASDGGHNHDAHGLPPYAALYFLIYVGH